METAKSPRFDGVIMTSRKERKQKRKAKRVKKPKISNKELDELAWSMARAMAKLPSRPFQGDMIINHLNEIG